jgi:hypothetical protein
MGNVIAVNHPSAAELQGAEGMESGTAGLGVFFLISDTSASI